MKGQKVVIKLLSSESKQGEKVFLNEFHKQESLDQFKILDRRDDGAEADDREGCAQGQLYKDGME